MSTALKPAQSVRKDWYRRARLRVVAFTGALFVATAATQAFLVVGHRHPATPFRCPWWVLALGFAASEIFVMHFQFRRETHTISLFEIPLIAGLVFASPTALLAGLAGSVLALGIHRRQGLLKLAFNLAHFALEASVGVVVFRALAPDPLVMTPRFWLAAGLAAVCAILLAAALVAAVISLHEGTMPKGRFGGMVLRAVAVGGLNITVALLTVELLWVDRIAVWLLVVPAVLLAFFYRSYGAIQRRLTDVETVYEFTRVVSRAGAAEEVMRAVLIQTRELMRAETAELIFLPSAVEPDPQQVTLSPDGRIELTTITGELSAVIQEVAREKRPVVLPRSTRDPGHRHHLDEHGWRDALAVPLEGSHGVVAVLEVGDRLDEVTTFNDEDARLFAALANHASVALENGRLLERLRHEALYDALTGLPNRTLFQERLRRTLETVPAGVAVMVMDLDRFKEINDSLGHHLGDYVLQQVAQRLAHAAPAGATVARLGGNEFAVLHIVDAEIAVVVELAESLRAAVSQPIPQMDLMLEVGARMGISLAPEHGDDPTLLLQRAGIAMHAAKQSITGVTVYSTEIDDSNPRRLALVGELRRAIADHTLSVHFQPKAAAGSGEIVGVEALVRWDRPGEGMLSPDEFIPLAERTGLIGGLTAVVLDEALAQCRRWHEMGYDLPVAVNLSPRCLLDPNLTSDVKHALDANGLPGAMLTLEVTEGAVMADIPRAIAVLGELNGAGIDISVDDFGTGYSSLAYLQRLPVQELKIDLSFVRPLAEGPDAEGPDAETIVRTIIHLGQNLGLRVVAEGVESQQVWDLLTAMGCDVVQGYVLSRPLAAEQLTAWLTHRGALAMRAG